jgi:hypothetical protein
MRRLFFIFFALLIVGNSPVLAADPNQIFDTILGEISRQIERKQQKKQLESLRPLWTACSKGDVAACDRAADFPNLTGQARADIERMREAAEQRPAYERNFSACQKMNQAACETALQYRYASDVDRSNLQNWRRAAIRQQALAQFHQNERLCYAGLIAACDAALAQRQLNESATNGIQSQRTRLLFAEEQRQLKERQEAANRQQALTRFRQNDRNCNAGSIAACDAALAQRQLDESAASRIQSQRTRLLFAENQRKAALREYTSLRNACTAGKRAACTNAVAHSQVPDADIAFLKRRDRELAPITERVVNYFADTQERGTRDGVPIGSIVPALLGFITLIGGLVGVRHVLRNHAASAGLRANEPPGLDAAPRTDPPVPFGGPTFPLTGHMPTDVRRALTGAKQ